MMKMKAVVVGDTVLLMDLVAIPGVKNAKQWIEVSRVEKQDYLCSFDKTMVAEFEIGLENKFKTGIASVRILGKAADFTALTTSQADELIQRLDSLNKPTSDNQED